MSVDDIAFPGAMATTSVNDVYSFDKELCEHGCVEKMSNNAVAFVMRNRNIGVGEAKQIVLEDLIPELEQKFIDKLNRYLNGADQRKSADMTKYLEAVVYLVTGNWYWSIYSERYNNHQDARPAPHSPIAIHDTTLAASAIIDTPKKLIVGEIPDDKSIGVVTPTASLNDEQKFWNDQVISPPCGTQKYIVAKQIDRA